MYFLATELAKDSGFDVHFLTQDLGQPARQVIAGVTIWRYWRPFKQSAGLTFLRRLVSWVSTLAMMLRIRPDIYIDSPASFMVAAARISSSLRGGQLVYRVASDADMDGSILRHAAERRLFLWGLRGAQALIARNRFQQSELRQRFGKDAVILPNAFPVPAAPPPGGKDGVLWVASAQQLKQPWLFLDLARGRPDTRFTMICPTNDARLFAKTRAQSFDLPNVEFLDGVPFEASQSYFDRAKLFVNTSTVEGFPNTFVQSAIGATPVLSLNVNPDDVLTVHGFGRCASGDLDRLTADLHELLDDDGLRQQMGEAGFEYAKRTHGIEAVAEELTGLLRAVAGVV